MESRVDYLKLHTGTSFAIPFEELVIFATNLEPEDLIDAAFLRRIPYKIEVGPPSLEQYRRIFEMECKRRNMPLSDEVFDFIVYMVREEKGWILPDSTQRSSWTRWRRRAGSWELSRSSGHPISIMRSIICGFGAIQPLKRIPTAGQGRTETGSPSRAASNSQ